MGGGNNYYPSFSPGGSPDGTFVVFNRSAGDSYDATDARVMVVSAAGRKTIDLRRINEVNVGNSWPKWAPFVHHFRGATIFWIAYSSRRPYGLRNLGNAQIWVVPVDTAKLAAGMDPGFPPFWLPFQDPMTGNHIPQWVEKAVPVVK